MTQKLLNPSREDAVRLTRNEKIAMMWMYQVATVLCELPKDLRGRIEMIPDGSARIEWLTKEVESLVDDLRVTIPEAQRLSLNNTAHDCEMRLAPKATPNETTVVIQKEEFRSLVDFARIQCLQCTETDTDCEKTCDLYKLLTVILPLDDYHSTFLCPYNLGEWKN